MILAWSNSKRFIKCLVIIGSFPSNDVILSSQPGIGHYFSLNISALAISFLFFVPSRFLSQAASQCEILAVNWIVILLHIRVVELVQEHLELLRRVFRHFDPAKHVADVAAVVAVMEACNIP